MGISWNEFWSMNPRIYKLHVKAFNEKTKREIKQQDELIWSMVGNYVLSAVTVAVERCLAGSKAKSKYIENPILRNLGEEELTEEERLDKEMMQSIANEEAWIRASKRKGLPETII